MKKYKVISLDLDGTLVDSNKEIPKANKEAGIIRSSQRYAAAIDP